MTRRKGTELISARTCLKVLSAFNEQITFATYLGHDAIRHSSAVLSTDRRSGYTRIQLSPRCPRDYHGIAGVFFDEFLNSR